MTLGQQLEVVQSLACFPALSLAVVLRRDIGYRALNPVGLAAVAAVMFLIPSMTNPENRPQDLQVFAGLVLALGLFQRFLRWQEFSRGVPQHSRYIGTSCFDAAFMPEFFRHERRLARFLDPLFCAVVGFALLHVSPALGAWIIFSALCLRLTEFAVYRLELNQKLDMVDGMSFAEVQAGTVEHFAEPPARESRPRQSAQGIPTGLGDDVERKINRGKSRQAPAQVPARKARIAAALLKPKLTRASVVLAFLIAVIADGLYFVVHYFVGWASGTWLGSQIVPQFASMSKGAEFAVDFVAMVLTIFLLGFHWALLPSLFVQFIPGIPRIPTWTACVAYVVWQRRKEQATAEPEATHDSAFTPQTQPEARLMRLAELHRQGLITDEEFQSRRRVILEEL